VHRTERLRLLRPGATDWPRCDRKEVVVAGFEKAARRMLSDELLRLEIVDAHVKRRLVSF
jgi:hypothetical protein